MTVQEIIDELSKIGDKTKTVRVYMKSGGMQGHVNLSGIDDPSPFDPQRVVYIDAIEREQHDA